MPDNKTLMIVDDSRVTRMMLSQYVREKHPQWTLLEAAQGEEALEKAEQADIDFFTVDLNMPGMDGLEVIRILQSRYSLSHMVLMTANIQDSVLERARGLGVECVHKPITEDKVDDILEILNA